MTDIELIIDHMNKVMEKNNITKAHLSRVTGIDKNSLGNYLAMRTSMPMHACIKIAKYLKVDISELCGIRNTRLDDYELDLLNEIRKVKNPARRKLIISLIEIIKNSAIR